MCKFPIPLPKKLGNRRGRVWLDCIINPYIDALRRLLEPDYMSRIVKVRVQSIIAEGHVPKLIEIECHEEDKYISPTGVMTYKWYIHVPKLLENIEDIYYTIPAFVQMEERFIRSLLLRERPNNAEQPYKPIQEFLEYLLKLRQLMATRYDIPFHSNQTSIFP